MHSNTSCVSSSHISKSPRTTPTMNGSHTTTNASHRTYLVSLCFFIYLEAQFPQGRSPSHLVFRDRQRSQLAQSAMEESSSAILVLAGVDGWPTSSFPCNEV